MFLFFSGNIKAYGQLRQATQQLCCWVAETFCRRPSPGVRDASIYRTVIYQFKQRIHFHGPCVIYERRGIACIYQCQSDMRGAIIYSVTQIYVLKGYKTALQPSHPISQLITVSAMCARACARWWGGSVAGAGGWAYDKRNALSISSRGDVLKGTLLLINAWAPTGKGTFCSFAKK